MSRLPHKNDCNNRTVGTFMVFVECRIVSCWGSGEADNMDRADLVG